jgi:predicted MFS family arabinose efflux permease
MSVTPKSTFGDSLALLQTRRFGTYCFATLLSNMGTWAQQVAEPWLLLSLGASSFLLGLDSFAAGAPVFLLTLIGGVLADHGDRRRIIAIFQSIQSLCQALLVVLLLAGAVEPWMVIALSFVVGITDALSMPSFSSIVPSIVERDQIPAAFALNSTQFNLSRILGPTLAGLVMASVGAIGCFALNAASYVPFIAVAVWILPRRGATVPARDRFDRRHLFAGVRAIARDPPLRGALLTVLASSTLCGPLMIFCPVLVKDAFQGDVGGFSIALGAFGVGGLIGAVGLLGVDAQRDRRRLSSWFAAGYGAILALAALDPWFWALPALLVAAGLSMTASNTSANTLLQAQALPQHRGQAASLYMLAMRGGLSFGSLVTGASVNLLGVREALLINGLLAVSAQVAIAWEWFRSPQVTSTVNRNAD